jgi:predicted DNA-binding transcriptional regulator YafY
MDALDSLRRWQAIDWLLARGRLNVPEFARRWGVSVRTVHRDLALFRAIGKRIESHREPSLCCRRDGRPVVQPHRQELTATGYADRVQPIFVGSLRRLNRPEPKPPPEPAPTGENC